jgi:serine/threonine protein kinase
VARKIGSRYSIDRVIGRGTCGTVWHGTGPDGPVAVKLLREDLAADQTLIARFVQERTMLTSLVHPNIVAVRDLVVDGTDLALIMDLIEGADLRGHLDRERALRPAEAAGLAGDVAAALAAAHARGVVHRDVKPENVLLDHGSPGRADWAGGPDGPAGPAAAGRLTARLTDFGIARLVDGPRRTRATRIVGTPDYLAPEVIEGCLPGPPVDVYALGTVLFELLTGWTPFGGGHPGAVLRRHVTETAPQVPGMPQALAELLNACLSKAPAARLTAAELADRLRELTPDLAGLAALRVPEPRAAAGVGEGAADPVLGRPMQVGALPLVRAMIEDETKQTHVNLIRPIKEPLGLSAPVPRAFSARAESADPATSPGDSDDLASSAFTGFPNAADVGDGAAGSADSLALEGLVGAEAKPSGPSARANRVAAIAAVLAAGLVAAGGTLWWQSGHGTGSGPAAGMTSAGPAAAGAPLGATRSALPADPAEPAGPVGPLGLVRLASAPAAPAKPLGAVAYADAGPDTAVLAATGTDGQVRVAVAAPGHAFAGWQALPGLVSNAAPSLVGRGSGQVELFAVSADSGQIERAVYQSGSWSPWAPVAASGADGEQFAGNPAAVLQPDGSTRLLAVSESGQLWSTVATVSADGSADWADWQVIGAAGPVKPGLALAVRPDGTLSAFVTRARDAAVLRVVDDGGWESAWPTGAVGRPAAAYTAGGQPYLFVQEITGDIQIFEPSGADLHGTMNWTTAGVTTANPPGVGNDGAAITLTVLAADGTVDVYTTGS